MSQGRDTPQEREYYVCLQSVRTSAVACQDPGHDHAAVPPGRGRRVGRRAPRVEALLHVNEPRRPHRDVALRADARVSDSGRFRSPRRTLRWQRSMLA
jgi:hypothetical protein